MTGTNQKWRYLLWESKKTKRIKIKKRKRNIRHRFLQIPVGEFAQTNSFISHAFATTSDSTQPITKQNKKEIKKSQKRKKRRFAFPPCLSPLSPTHVDQWARCVSCLRPWGSDGCMDGWIFSYTACVYVCVCMLCATFYL